MRRARVLVNGVFAGILEEISRDRYCLTYQSDYVGAPVSLHYR